jgi:hypothetical protein
MQNILDPSYPHANPLPPTTSTLTAPAVYDACWALSEPFWEIVVDDRLAANPINHVDPTGLHGSPGGATENQLMKNFKSIQGSYIAGRGTFRAGMYRLLGSAKTHIDIEFHPDESVTKGCNCDRIAFVQVVETDKLYHTFYGIPLITDIDNPSHIDATIPDVFYPAYAQTEWSRFSRAPLYASMYDEPGTGTYALNYLFQSFRTYAICTKGKEAGHSYGFLHWGQMFDYKSDAANIFIDGIGSAMGKATDQMTINWVGKGVGPKETLPRAGSFEGSRFSGYVWTPLGASMRIE